MTNILTNSDINIRGGVSGELDNAGIYWNYGGSQISDNGSLNVITKDNLILYSNNIYIDASSYVMIGGTNSLMYFPNLNNVSDPGGGRAIYWAANNGGYFFITGGSSLDKKKNIETLPDNRYSLENFMKINPVLFNYKTDTDLEKQRRIGFIADQFDELGLNELVCHDNDGNPTDFYYDKLTSYITKIVKIQQTKIDELTQEINNIKAKLT